jgi:hypothetical protein
MVKLVIEAEGNGMPDIDEMQDILRIISHSLKVKICRITSKSPLNIDILKQLRDEEVEDDL